MSLRRRMMLANQSEINGLVDGVYEELTVTDGNQIAQNGTVAWKQINMPLRKNIAISTGDTLVLQFDGRPVDISQDWYYIPVSGSRKTLVFNDRPSFVGRATVDADGEMWAIQFMARTSGSGQATFRIHLFLNDVQLF